MIGHENAGCPGVQALASGHLDFDAEDTSPDPHHPITVSEERVPETEERAEEQDGDGQNDQEGVNEDEDSAAHGPSGTIAASLLYDISFRNRCLPSYPNRLMREPPRLVNFIMGVVH